MPVAAAVEKLKQFLSITGESVITEGGAVDSLASLLKNEKLLSQLAAAYKNYIGRELGSGRPADEVLYGEAYIYAVVNVLNVESTEQLPVHPDAIFKYGPYYCVAGVKSTGELLLYTVQTIGPCTQDQLEDAFAAAARAIPASMPGQNQGGSEMPISALVAYAMTNPEQTAPFGFRFVACQTPTSILPLDKTVVL